MKLLKRQDLRSPWLKRQMQNNLHTGNLCKQATYKLFRGAQGSVRSYERKLYTGKYRGNAADPTGKYSGSTADSTSH